MYNYKYTGEGMLKVRVDGQRIKLAVGHPTLKDTVELPKKLEECSVIGDTEKLKKLELVEDREMRKSRKGE